MLFLQAYLSSVLFKIDFTVLNTMTYIGSGNRLVPVRQQTITLADVDQKFYRPLASLRGNELMYAARTT